MKGSERHKRVPYTDNSQQKVFTKMKHVTAASHVSIVAQKGSDGLIAAEDLLHSSLSLDSSYTTNRSNYFFDDLARLL